MFFGILLLSVPRFSVAQDEDGMDVPDIKLKVGGTVQSWASYQMGDDFNQMGFGLRRVRGRFSATFSENLKSFVQFEMTTFKLLDARIQYIINKNVELRVGRFIGAGMRGAGLTSHKDIDIVERPVTAQMWGSNTVGADYRDYGAEGIFKGKVGEAGTLTGRLWIHNGGGALNLKPSHKGDSAPVLEDESTAIDAMATFKAENIKGLELGGHFGIGNKDVADYSNYSAFVYWEPKPIRIKAEIASTTLDGGSPVVAGDDLTFMGYYVFGAFRFADNWEGLARFETVDPDTDSDDDESTDITVGLSYSFWPAQVYTSKITGAYVIQSEGDALGDIDNNIFYVMFQVIF